MRWTGAVVMVALVQCDSSGAITSCPPAPLRFDGGDIPCNLSGSCAYHVPVLVGTPQEDPCNATECTCTNQFPFADGGQPILGCAGLAMGCGTKVAVCPSGAVAGNACVQVDAGWPDWGGNGECLVLGPGADLSQGIVNGQACACDFPGPIWRCVPAATTKPQ